MPWPDSGTSAAAGSTFRYPGSPPTKTREPATMPLPSTRSSSPISSWVSGPVPLRTLSCQQYMALPVHAGISGSPSRRPGPAGCLTVLPPVPPPCVFHSLHAGHCPSHLAGFITAFLAEKCGCLCFCHVLLMFMASTFTKLTEKGWNRFQPVCYLSFSSLYSLDQDRYPLLPALR